MWTGAEVEKNGESSVIFAPKLQKAQLQNSRFGLVWTGAEAEKNGESSVIFAPKLQKANFKKRKRGRSGNQRSNSPLISASGLRPQRPDTLARGRNFISAVSGSAGRPSQAVG